MRIDAYTHFIPKQFFEAVEKVPGAGTDIGKRMRGVPCVYDLDERRRIVGLFPGLRADPVLPDAAARKLPRARPGRRVLQDAQ